MKQKISHKNLFLALSLATLFFIVGILLGGWVVSQRYSEFSDTLNDLTLQANSLEIQYELLKENPCNGQDVSMITEELSQLGNHLSYLETVYGKDSSKIKTLKIKYSHLQIYHYIFYSKVQEECNKDLDLILYFYSNDKSCETCEEQGIYLSKLKEMYPENVLVYSFDINLDDIAVKTLKEIYIVNNVPSIVFNGLHFDNLVSLEQLKKLVEN